MLKIKGLIRETEARAAAFAARYPPRGGRSSGGALTLHFGSDYDQWVNDQLFLAVQIESVKAVEHAEEILGVDGIDGCWIGPADLARSMGVPPTSARRATISPLSSATPLAKTLPSRTCGSNGGEVHSSNGSAGCTS